ncbi:MAG TPA: hypothetical protein PK040_05120 [Anaerolineaceae bacterium]|nr:hypothetical protein [Anaerolineaceae bacterium]
MFLPIILGIVIVLAVLVGVVLFITRPFFKNDEDSKVEAAPALVTDEDEYQNTLKRIRELDFDFQLGKVSEEDHAALREELKLEAAERLKRIHAAETPATAENAGE